MKIQDLDWVTHTHTDYYDVCNIYDGEMPSYLWGKDFWENHYYLINSNHKFNKEEFKLSGNIFYYDEDLNYPIRLINILSNLNSEIVVLDHEDMILYRQANLKEIIATDSIPIPQHKQLDNLKILSTADLLAEVIKRNIEHESISTLFN